MTASCSLGGAQASLEAAIEHMDIRKQFQKKLNEFQVSDFRSSFNCLQLLNFFNSILCRSFFLQYLQFRIAEMSTSLVTSRLLLRQAAVALQESRPERVALCSMAKLFATEHCSEVIISSSIHLHCCEAVIRLLPHKCKRVSLFSVRYFRFDLSEFHFQRINLCSLNDKA